MAGKKTAALTEGQLVKLLRARYEQDNGNGMAGGLIPHVRDAASFDSRRTIDALGINYWKSRGLLIDAFECKSARSDWLRELAAPEKADRFCQLADRFWIVAGRNDIVREDEVPPDWGLLVPRGNGLTQVKAAKLLHPDDAGSRVRPLPPGFDRSFLIAILRQALKVSNATPEDVEAARREGYAAGEASATHSQQHYKALHDELFERVREFQAASGIVIGGRWGHGASPKQVGEAVHAVLRGEADTAAVEMRLRSLVESAESVAAQARQALDRARAVGELAGAA